MSIIVNGNNIEWVKNETVEQLIKRMKYTFPLLVVKINEKVILKKDFSITIVPDKSKIAIIHMISGG
jgi:thiamine biosynthesis protein ThiS